MSLGVLEQPASHSTDARQTVAGTVDNPKRRILDIPELFIPIDYIDRPQ